MTRMVVVSERLYESGHLKTVATRAAKKVDALAREGRLQRGDISRVIEEIDDQLTAAQYYVVRDLVDLYREPDVVPVAWMRSAAAAR